MVLLYIAIANFSLSLTFQLGVEKQRLSALSVALIGMPMMMFKEIFVLNYTFHWLHESTRYIPHKMSIKRVMSHSATLLQIIRCLDTELSHISGTAIIYFEGKMKNNNQLAVMIVMNTVPALLIIAANCFLSHCSSKKQRHYLSNNFDLF